MTTIRVQASWELRRCSECGQNLPSDWDWDVRSLAWMHDLPRRISPSNNDLSIHDGGTSMYPRNRFLHLEFKRDGRKLSEGQARHITGLSQFDRHGVLVVRGKRVDHITVQPVLRGEWGDVYDTTCESLNGAIATWLGGDPWQVASSGLLVRKAHPNAPEDAPGHTHGYGRDENGVMRCIQDYYAKGVRPETGCGHVVEAA